MDLIDRAILSGETKKLTMFSNCTWKSFDKAVKMDSKKLFIFGSGGGFRYFLNRYGSRYQVQGIIDNNVEKQGHTIGEYDVLLYGEAGGNLPVYGVEKLNDSDNIVVLISPLYDSAVIMEEMKGYNHIHFFSLLLMEEDRRKHEKEEYATECIDFPIDKNKIVFFSFENGGRFGDHGKYITEELIRRPEADGLDIVWTINSLNADLPDGVRPIYIKNWKSVIREAETAKMWISCDPLPPYLIKRKGQIYIQTKHWASVTLKTFYLDDRSFEGVRDYYEKWQKNGDMMDFCFVGSKFDEESCRRGFGFKGDCIEVGSPRSDTMFRNKKNKEKIYNYYGIPRDMRCVIYAPTFRFLKDTCESMIPDHHLDYDSVLTSLKRRFGGEWMMLLRYHPQAKKPAEIEKTGKRLIDTGGYPDSQELASAADIMISDYSSIMFEPAFSGKPVFLYAPDREHYVGGERELLIPYDELPFPIATDNDGLMEIIESFDENNYRNELNLFMNRYGVHEDGHASERAVDFILKKMGKR